MPCSERKRQANQLNAQKSTGPRTGDGKARASQNALKHGLTARAARAAAVLGEDPEEFQAFAEALRQDLKPRGAMQAVLVERIIATSWKLQRVPEVEAKVFEESEQQVRHNRVDERGMRLPATVAEVIADVGCQAYFGRLQLYEMRLERSLHACLRQLERMKKMQNEANEEEEEEEEVEESRAETNTQNEATATEDSK